MNAGDFSRIDQLDLHESVQSVGIGALVSVGERFDRNHEVEDRRDTTTGCTTDNKPNPSAILNLRLG